MANKPKVKIKVGNFVADVRNGVDDTTLIQKYSLTQEMLPKVFEQLIAGGHLSEGELASRNAFESTQQVADLFSFSFGAEEND